MSRFSIVLWMLPLSLCALATQLPAQHRIPITAPDSEQTILPALRDNMQYGAGRIERFFGHRFVKTFRTEVFPDRASFNTCLEQQLAISQPQRWMVAAGVSDRFVLLTPRVWATDADEHDPEDTQHVRDLVTHELVHVYHGQYNPSHHFDGMDDLGWLVEGVAVYVSGQLEHAYQKAAKQAIQEGKSPQKLADAWSGRYRYGVSGSIVKYIDKRYGRKMLWRLLKVVKPEEALRILHATETEFLDSWKRSVLADTYR